MIRHEGDHFWGNLGCSSDEIGLVFAARIINDDNHFTCCDVGDDFADRMKNKSGHWEIGKGKPGLGNGGLRRWGGGIGKGAGFDMEIALWEGDFDVVVAESLPDSK